jgi:hypothetical protein
MSLSFVSPYLIHEMALEGACRAKKGTRKYFSMDVPVASINDLQETKNNMLNIYIYIERERERIAQLTRRQRRRSTAALRCSCASPSRCSTTPRLPAGANTSYAGSSRTGFSAFLAHAPRNTKNFCAIKRKKAKPRSLVHTNSGRATAAEPNKLLLISLQLLFTSDNDSINIMKLNP